MMIKQYLKDVCNHEKDIHEAQLKLQKMRDEKELAKSLAETKKKKLQTTADEKLVEVRKVENSIKEARKVQPPNIIFEMLTSAIIIIVTLLMQAAIRFFVLDVWHATSVSSATFQIAMIFGVLTILCCLLLRYTGFEISTIISCIVGYIITVVGTYMLLNYFMSSGANLNKALLILHILFVGLEVIGAVIFCINKKAKYQKDYEKKLQHIKNLKKKFEGLSSEQLRLSKAVADFDESSKKSLSLMSQDIARQEKYISSVQNKLSKLYAQNVLHPNYQNWVAAATIYEYLDVGRCFELKGVHGAYNLYERELIAKKILASLSDINSGVRYYGSQVNSSQQYIKEQLKECNRNIENLEVNRYGL